MGDEPDKPGLFEELKRRRMFRVATLYAVVAWLLVQIGEATFEPLGLPDGSQRLLIILLALGLPVALVLGWIFDVTPEGIVRTARAPGGKRADLFSGRRIDFVIIGALLLAVGILVWGPPRDSLRDDPDPVSSRAKSEIPSILVLPFDDMSQLGDQAYFAHGMSEELMNVLAQTAGLRVMGRTTAEVVKRRGLTAAEIGQLLGVEALLEGSVRRSKDQVRITAQLISVEDGFHLWSKAYERPMTDIFELQDEVAREVAMALEVVLVGRRERPPTRNLQAYESYLRGRMAYGMATEEAMRAAIAPLEEALALDPEYVDALVALGFLYVGLYRFGYDFDQDNLRRGEQLARRALEIDGRNPSAYAVLGSIHEFNYDLEAAEAAYQRAVEYGPQNGRVHTHLGILRVALGEVEDGLRLMDEAISLDPLRFTGLAVAGWTQARVGDPEYAARLLNNAIEIEPRSPIGWGQLADAYDMSGQDAEALEALIGMGFPPETVGAIRRAYGEGGMKGVWAVYLERLQARSGLECTSNPGQGIHYLLRLERYESALRCIEESVGERTLGVQFYLKVNPRFDPIRGDPRFQAALEKMGLAD